MYFSFMPPIKIVGTIKKKINVRGLENVKNIKISPNDVVVEYLDEGRTLKQVEVFTFQTIVPEIFRWVDPNTLPLELIPLASVEVLEAISKLIDGFALIFSDLPEGGYFDVFRGDIYPLSVRRPDKTSYASTFKLRKLPKNYFTAVDSVIRHNIEEQLEYTLKTFVVNVIYPFEHKIRKGVHEATETDINRFLSRTRDLITIINSSFPAVEERQKAFLRLALPIMLKHNLTEGYSEYVSVENTPNESKLRIAKYKEIKAEDILNIIIRLLD